MSRIYPSQADVVNAIQNADLSIKDPFLKGSTYQRNKMGRPLSYSGGYSIVFPFEVKASKVAVRCWIAGIDDIEMRLNAISAFFKQVQSPYFVNFEYVRNGLFIDNQFFPLVRMDWVEGLTLRDFVQQHLRNQQKLESLADRFLEMCVHLHSLGISHGDLQHGNIVVRSDDSIRLIDYDSVYVPSLQGYSQVVAGLESYQHPLRKTTSSYGPNTDYFSELIIYLSLKVLARESDLWQTLNLDKEDNSLLFRMEDLANPAKSPLFPKIARLGLSFSRLSNLLVEYLGKTNLNAFLPLEEIVAAAGKAPWDGKLRKATSPPPPGPTNIDVEAIKKKWERKSSK